MKTRHPYLLVRLLAGALCLFGFGGSVWADTLMQTGHYLFANTTFQWAPDPFGPPYSQNLGAGSDQLSLMRNGLASNLRFQPSPLGPAEGTINYLRIDETIPPVTASGMFAATDFTDTIGFSGAGLSGSVGNSAVYYAYSWRITNRMANPLGAEMSFSIGGLGSSLSFAVRG